MMSSSQVIWLACLLFLFIGVIGAAIGYFASLIMRRTWGIRTAAWDVATAIAVAFIYGYVVGEIQMAHGNGQDVSKQAIIVGMASVILKHALQVAFRSHRRS